MRVLVTGGCGFVGANLIRRLLRDNYQITILDNLSTGQQAYIEGLDVNLIIGDIRFNRFQ